MDYNKMALVAQRLIEANGRPVDIIRYQREVSDPAKPWRGNTNPRQESMGETEEVTVLSDILASFVEPSSLVRFGYKSEDFDGVRRAEEVALIAAASLSGSDLSNFDEIIDNTTRYKIGLIRRIAPAGVALLYMVGVTR